VRLPYYVLINFSTGTKKGLDLTLTPCFIWSWRWESNPRPA